ncbi:MAG TPA: STAS domain-containing protein [Ilumatobacteraceae bacterium]|nr:STAS domain-containing protein [Ilumatobacteraceae bacterium]
MTAMLQARPDSDASIRSPDPRLLLDVFIAPNTCVVHVTGELDLATRNQLVSATTAGHHPEMMIDLGGLTFMDCSGYRALVASRRIIEGEGRSLTIKGQTGQPARFLDLIAELEQ